MLNERPQTEGIGYYVGLIRYRKKDYQGALKAFRAETSKNPNIQQLVRFYSGLTLAILGLPEQAVAEVDAALRLQTGSALTGPAERIRDTLASAREAERRFHAEVRVGFLYDSNVAVVPQPSHDPTAEALRGRKTATPGELAALRLEYAWLRSGPWESTVTYSFFQTYNNRLPSFNVQNHLVAGALSYRAAIGSMPFQVGAQYSWDYLSLGGDDFLQRHTATLFGTLVENKSNLTTVLGRFQNKDFYASPGSSWTRIATRGTGWSASRTSSASRRTGTTSGWAISSTTRRRTGGTSPTRATASWPAGSTRCPGGRRGSSTTSICTSATTCTPTRCCRW